MRVCKRILSAIISLALSLLVVMAGIFPAILPASAEETSKSVYEQTNVLDDLKKATVNGEPFNLTKYNFDESKPTQVISFVEYCYSFYSEKQDNFGLYAVKDSDMTGTAAEVSQRLFISESDYAEFSNYYNTHKNTSTVY